MALSIPATTQAVLDALRLFGENLEPLHLNYARKLDSARRWREHVRDGQAAVLNLV